MPKEFTRKIKTNLPESYDKDETEVTLHVVFWNDDPYPGADGVEIDWIEGTDGKVVDVPESVMDIFMDELYDGVYDRGSYARS